MNSNRIGDWLLEIGIQIEKAETVTEIVMQEYFGQPEADPAILKAYYQQNDVLVTVIHDYILKSQKKLDELADAIKKGVVEV